MSFAPGVGADAPKSVRVWPSTNPPATAKNTKAMPANEQSRFDSNRGRVTSRWLYAATSDESAK